MTSEQKGREGQEILHICGQTEYILRTKRGREVKKAQHSVDVIYDPIWDDGPSLGLLLRGRTEEMTDRRRPEYQKQRLRLSYFLSQSSFSAIFSAADPSLMLEAITVKSDNHLLVTLQECVIIFSSSKSKMFPKKRLIWKIGNGCRVLYPTNIFLE